jgi:DNA-binding transcriptional LysR family regulator
MIYGYSQWLKENVSDENIILTSDSFEALRLMTEQGMGLSLLPCFVGEASQKLQRVNFEISSATVGLWIVTHKDVASSARVQAFTDFMLAELKSEHSRLAGLGHH